MMDDRKKVLKQLKKGTTEILILTVLTQGEHYGYEISREVFQRTHGFFDLKQGFLYPTLRRMEQNKLILGAWRTSTVGGPNRKYYRLTPRGRSCLDSCLLAWSQFNREFTRILAIAKPPQR